MRHERESKNGGILDPPAVYNEAKKKASEEKSPRNRFTQSIKD